MWEAIRANQRRSLLLIMVMGLILVALGATIGQVVANEIAPPDEHEWQRAARLFDHNALVERGLAPAREPARGARTAAPPWGALIGAGVAIVIWLGLWLTAAVSGDAILLRAGRAFELEKSDAPQLWNVVEEMTIAAGLPRMPRVFLVDDPSMNAFAVGYYPDRAAVAVTAGLLKRLSRDELQGVIAHEIGHIRNRDVRFMTLAGVMVGAIVLLSRGFLRGVLRGGVGRRRGSGKGGGAGVLIVLAIAVILAIVAPIAAQLLYFACSRKREYLADASAALFTRYPEGLASALKKIAGQSYAQVETSDVIAPLCIVNPLQARAAFTLFSTHPPTEKRIQVLRGMAGAGLAAYQAAYEAVHGRGAACVGARSLAESADVDKRSPAPGPEQREEIVQQARLVGRLLDKALALVVIGCPCGAQLKLTPDDALASITCPRCGRSHDVPQAERQPARDEAGATRAPAPERPLRYRRRTSGWESFRCVCGGTVQLSPKFSAERTSCPRCHRTIQVTGATGGAPAQP